jgi:hypothetical protein
MNGFNDPIKDELEKDERLYWSGQPASGIKLGPYDIFFIPFSIMWAGFIIVWEIIAISTGAPFAFSLFGIPFILIGLYMIFGRFIIDSKQRKQTFYGVTDKRVIIKKGIYTQTVNSLQLDSINEVSVSTKTDGSGTITFGRHNLMWPRYNLYFWGMGNNQVPEFRYIPDVNNVNRIIKENQKKLKSE